jgi:hypothetical protein
MSLSSLSGASVESSTRNMSDKAEESESVLSFLVGSFSRLGVLGLSCVSHERIHLYANYEYNISVEIDDIHEIQKRCHCDDNERTRRYKKRTSLNWQLGDSARGWNLYI